MKIGQIYKTYFIPKNLQEHMLRVTALAEIILEHWIGKKVDNQAIIQACILHDIAKPMNFDLTKQALFDISPSDNIKLEKLQKDLKTKYGTDEHSATVKICEEIGLSPVAVKILKYFEWSYIPYLLKTGNTESLISVYCDMRISPKGILPLYKRLNELKKRNHAKNYEENVKNGKVLEDIIKKNITLDINSVTDAQLNKRFKNLLNIEI